MKKLLFIFSILLLTGCSTSKPENDASLDLKPIESETKVEMNLGFRSFSIDRADDGNIPLNTKTDIPNGYKCYLLDAIPKNKAFEDISFVSFRLEDSENDTKNLVVYELEGLLGMPIKDLYSLTVEYFCAHSDMVLNNSMYLHNNKKPLHSFSK